MEGFTVRNSLGGPLPRRSGEDSYFAYGGGLFADSAGSLQLKNMSFVDNRAVGGDRGSGKGGAGSGGAVAMRNVPSATMDNVHFENNQAVGGTGATRGGVAHGGAIATFASTLTATNVTFLNNLAHAGSSAATAKMGAAPMPWAAPYRSRSKASERCARSLRPATVRLAVMPVSMPAVRLVVRLRENRPR